MEKLTEKQQRKRRQILDAAMHCFIEKGFHSTSTAEICKAAGMSPGICFITIRLNTPSLKRLRNWTRMTTRRF